VAEGTPDDLRRAAGSVTGRFLAEIAPRPDGRSRVMKLSADS
jgi:hypothetical protein